MSICYCATLTLADTLKQLERLGVSIGMETLRDGIEQGVLPFGICVTRAQRTFVVSKKKFIEWCEDFIGATPEFD